jgi:pimeloyl-ACP methyl ester carboxylesterase
MIVEFVQLAWRGRSLQIEYAWLNPQAADAPLMVFLHEGLGSVAMWRDFPARLCAKLGVRGLVYSRPGYGRSSSDGPEQALGPDFMHRQAHEVLPALLRALDVDRPVWLLGHSDGGSIALLHAAKLPTAGLIVLAPHILVEELSVSSIEKARLAYLETDLRQRLARYHVDPDAAFWGWNRIWLDPAFRHWSIEAEIGTIGCPVLAVQGLDDEYGSLEQIRGIARMLPKTRLLELPDCGHSPHKDQPEFLLDACASFFFMQQQPSTA